VSQDKAAAAPAADQGSRNLLMRVAAALVLAPGAIGLAYAGGWPWATLVTVVAIGLYVEWLTIVGAAKDWRVIAAGGLALATGGVCLGQARLDGALGALSLGLVVVALVSPLPRRWTVTGFCYAATALVGSILVRIDPVQGFTALILILLVVWVTDIGGYFAGRGLGGPKLWPRVSPKKTWAGALGGFFASLAIGAGFAAWGLGKLLPLLMLVAILSVVSQLGDLFESAVKRQFGVKDSSHIIPGHGGLLDRLDGFVAAVAFAGLFGVLRAGVDGVGRGLMVW
jgi:phosphatidate cytidylyltransferase